MKFSEAIDRLSLSEGRVFNLLLSSKSIEEISQELEVSNKTVRFHTGNILKKLDVKSRVHLMSEFISISKSDPDLRDIVLKIKEDIENIKAQIHSQTLPSSRPTWTK